MRYKSFKIQNYRAIKHELNIDLENRIIPLIGINECGKTTILQAIYCFDKSNDKEHNGKHLEDINNLYETEHTKPAIITATIETTPSEIDEIIQDELQKYKVTKGSEEIPELDEYYSLLSAKKNQSITIILSRNLDNKNYSFGNIFHSLPENLHNTLGSKMLLELPYILYNDDFNDRPPDTIIITDKKAGSKTGWEAIFDRIFESTNSAYSLNKCLSEPDSKTRMSIISDVQNYLSDALTKEWKRFSPQKEKISIRLDLNVETSSLEILIEDTLNGKSRYFSISNRSKGFIWYYNFIMKVRFNPKYTENIKDTVFLLDEPGSYLHEKAQESLCKKLKDISNNEGIVVYCTHSPKLLSPTVIPINNILIVDKSPKGYISTINIHNYQTSSKRASAMQPVYEALMIPEYVKITSSDKVLCVEGIYDKYAIELFTNLPDNCIVFPSVNAESIINNIQYFIAYKIDYLALWDNDEEGKKCYGKAKSMYGTHESDNFLLLPSKDSGKRRMEEMFENDDLSVICAKMNLPESSTYETVLSTLYFLKPSQKHIIVDTISPETKKNFQNLSKAINKSYGN